MKIQKILTLFVAIIAIGSLTITSCKKKPIQKVEGQEEIIVPFMSKEFKTNKEYFRARSSGKSSDLETARKIAVLNAKGQLASSMQSTIKRVTEQYTNQVNVGNKEEFQKKFEDLTRESTNQTMNDVNVMAEKVLRDKADGSYEYWVVVEASRETVFNNISNSQKVKLDYDKKKFEEIFNQEMQKLENGQ